MPRAGARRLTGLRVQHARCFSEALDLDFNTNVFDKQAYQARTSRHRPLSPSLSTSLELAAAPGALFGTGI